MTGMEQGLRYIEREIRFMVKDQFGNSTYAKYADRVIEDACGIPNFCTTVLSSKRPLTAILRAVRGPRGDVIMRFFNSALHDARIEMVMVLAEAIKLRSHKNKASRDAHEYLMKLYRKAIKRTIRLITGSKNKESYKSMYRGLRSFARMDDFGYDEEDDDDDFFDSEEFGDSDFAESCLEAYRDGKLPPEPAIACSNAPKLKGNEEILEEISAIEAKIGRHLTDVELDKLLCGDDDEDIESDPIIPMSGVNSDKIDALADAIYARVMEKIGVKEDPKPETSGYETLDEFLDRQNTKPNEEAQVSENTQDADIPYPTDIPISTTNRLERFEIVVEPETHIPRTFVAKDSPHSELQGLINAHNRLKNALPVKEDAADDSSDSENGELPPNDELGGNDEVETAVEVDYGYDEESEEDVEESSSEDCYEAVVATEGSGECPPHLQHSLMVGEVITDFSDKVKKENQLLINRLTNYFDRLGTVEITDISISLIPSSKIDKLLNLIVTVRVTGDYEIANKMHINTVVVMHVSNLAKLLDIPDKMIDSDLAVVYSDTTLDSDVGVLNTNAKRVEDIQNVACAIALYAYRRLGRNVDVRYINHLDHDEFSIYINAKGEDSFDLELESFCMDELAGEGMLDEITDAFSIGEKTININLPEDDFLSDLNNVLINSKEVDCISFMNKNFAHILLLWTYRRNGIRTCPHG